MKDIREEDPNGTLDMFSFKKIISAQNCLLFDSNILLFEIGKKFSFYLFPFGKSFEEIIKDINISITTDWKVEIINNDNNKITLQVQKCIFCSEIGVPCEMFKGFLINSLEKSLPSEYHVVYEKNEEDVNDPEHNNFILQLKIEKSLK